MVSPAYSADGRFKLLHDVYQSKTRSTSRTSPPARERSHERTPSPGDCASFGFQLESSSRPKAPLAAALAGSCGDTLLDLHSDGLLCDELCFLSRTAIGPPPNVTLAWVSLHLTMGDSSPPRVHSDNHVTKHTGRRVVFASSKTNTREGTERIRRGRPLVPRSRRSALGLVFKTFPGADSFLSCAFKPLKVHKKQSG